MTRIEGLRRLALAGIAGALIGPHAASAGEASIEAFSAWNARGQIFPTGPSEVTFVGVLSGILIVHGDDQSTDTGQITCPASVVINPADLSQIGHAKCVIVTPDAERVYGEFSCVGTYGQGCDGDFMLTGGTGSKAGITGGGPIRIRGVSTALATHESGNLIDQETAGIAVWPALHYSLP